MSSSGLKPGDQLHLLVPSDDIPLKIQPENDVRHRLHDIIEEVQGSKTFTLTVDALMKLDLAAGIDVEIKL